MKQYGFGIDLGGTTVKLGFFDRQGALLEKWEIPTRPSGGTGILEDIAQAVNGYLAGRGIKPQEVLGIGIGIPGPIQPDGFVRQCPNIGWKQINVREILSEATGIPVQGGNDANVAALGESWKGGAAGCQSMVLFTLGTGIGGGIIVDGKILSGAHGAGGEVGHIPTSREEQDHCGCGKQGCAEQYGSATGIVRTAKKMLAESSEPSALRALPEITCKDIFDIAAGGDALAKTILTQVYNDLGFIIAKVACVIDPEVIVIGGGVSKAGQVLLDGIRPYYRKYAFPVCGDTPIVLAQLGNDAGIYGAVKLALDAFSEKD